MENNVLTEGPVFKKLMIFTFPILGAYVLQALYGTVDVMIVGLFTTASEVSAVSTGSMTMSTITGVITGLTMGATVLLGNSIGMKDYKKASRGIASSGFLFMMIGILLTVSLVLLAAPVSELMNAPVEAFYQTVNYIRICGIGVICIVAFNALSGIFRGLGDSKTPLKLMAISCTCNIIGDLFLVGVLKLGSMGAAIATVVSQGISVVCVLMIVAKNGFGFKTEKEYLKPALTETLQILKYGVPIAAQQLFSGISFMIIMAILNGFGVIASAGVGVAEKLCSLMFVMHSSMTASISAFSAQNVGAGLNDRARTGMYYGMIVTFVIGLFMFTVSYFKGVWLAQMFSNDIEVCYAAADYLKSYSIDSAIVGFNFCMSGYLNGNGKTGFVALQGTLSTFLVRIPVSYFMSKTSGASLFRVGLATPLATVFAIIITGIYLFNFEKRNRVKTAQI